MSENVVLFLLHNWLQSDESLRRSWAARNALQLAQRLHHLSTDAPLDVASLASYLLRRRQPLCWCLLLLGGRADVQLLAATELRDQCTDPEVAVYLQQWVLMLRQQQQTDVSPSLLLLDDEGAEGEEEGDDGEEKEEEGAEGPSEEVADRAEHLAALLARVQDDGECLELVAHAALHGGMATLASLLGLMAGAPLSAVAAHAARALALLAPCPGVKEELLAAGAVPLLLGCLAAGPTLRVAEDVAQSLSCLCRLEAAGREVLRVPGPAGVQPLIALLRGGTKSPAAAPAVRALAHLASHPPLRPGLVAAGALDALMAFVKRAGGPWAVSWPAPAPAPASASSSSSSTSSSASAGSGSRIGSAGAGILDLALLALVRCIRSSGGSREAHGEELPGPALQLLLDVVAMPAPPAATESPRHGGGGIGGWEFPAASTIPMVVVEATEALADTTRDVAGAMRVLEFQGHLVLLQRLLAILPPSPVPGTSLDPLLRRQLDASLRALARAATAAPYNPDLRLARTPEALLHVLLAFGLADRPGWWALQGLCALAADFACASDLVRAGMLPPVVAALRGLAAAQTQQRAGTDRSSSSGRSSGRLRDSGLLQAGGGSGGASASGSAGEVQLPPATPRRNKEVAHLLGLLLQNTAGHKSLARLAISEGAVPAICEWLAVCVASDDVEGAVLCCATICLLGDGDQGALMDMVHSDGIDTLVELLHPRWATAALVPATVASAIAVTCRWPAAAQAVRMAKGIPALADTLRGPHGLACCRPVVNALVDLITNDPPALREIRTTNTVIALGTQLQLLPDNDPRATSIRVLLRQLGEDPDTAMRLANSEADIALANAAAVPHHQHHHRHPNGAGWRYGQQLLAATGEGLVPEGTGQPPSRPSLRLDLNSWRQRYARPSESGPARLPRPQDLRSWRASSPGAIVPQRRRSGTLSGGPAEGSSTGDLDSMLATLKGESSYKSLRRASLKQLAKRMDASDFSDVEDDVEDYMAVLEVPSRDHANAIISRAASLHRSDRSDSFGRSTHAVAAPQGAILRTSTLARAAAQTQAQIPAPATAPAPTTVAAAPAPAFAPASGTSPPDKFPPKTEAAALSSPSPATAAVTAVVSAVATMSYVSRDSDDVAPGSATLPRGPPPPPDQPEQQQQQLHVAGDAAVTAAAPLTALGSQDPDRDSDSDPDPEPQRDLEDYFHDDAEVEADLTIQHQIQIHEDNQAWLSSYELDEQPLHPQHAAQHGDGRRGRNPVVHTLRAVNPLRLFGAGRRLTVRFKGVEGESPEAAHTVPRARRRSLQVEGDELVFWSAGMDS